MPFRIIKGDIKQIQATAVVEFSQNESSEKESDEKLIRCIENKGTGPEFIVNVPISKIQPGIDVSSEIFIGCLRVLAIAAARKWETLCFPIIYDKKITNQDKVIQSYFHSLKSFFDKDIDSELEVYLVSEKKMPVFPTQFNMDIPEPVFRLLNPHRFRELNSVTTCCYSEAFEELSPQIECKQKSKKQIEIVSYNSCCKAEIDLEASRRLLDDKYKPLETLLKQKGMPFPDVLMKIIADRKMENRAVYKAANIDSKLFSKIICTKDYVPSKKTVMALAIGLKLTYPEAVDFLASAGYAFSKNDNFDLIVSYFIRDGNYDMYIIEQILFQVTGKTLGSSKFAQNA